MEYIKKEELKDGDVFVSQMSHNHFLNKYGTGYSLHLNLDNTIRNQLLYRGGGFAYNNMRLATFEEKHWLNECIKLNKFITFEEAMKTFIPEYVECIKEVIEPLPQFKVIETIETITKVENNEGNQFFIGDVVISDSGFVQTIKSFRYNVNKDNVLATTNVCNQISIDKIEHYIEPKVEETLLEKAKRLYPIGTKVKTVCFGRVTTIKTDIFHETNHDLDKVIYADNGNISIYSEKENHWATIIE